MACVNCNKPVQLNNCDDCDFTINTDCVDYTGDKFSFEDSTVRNGSSRTLTEILEGLVSSNDCVERTSKVVTGDYTVIEDDICKIILLNGTIETPADVNYTITLPEDESFINKIIVIKDISEGQTPSGEVIWSFDSTLKFNWSPEQSSSVFSELACWPHKILYLTYIQTTGLAYSWVVISPSTMGYDVVEEADLTITSGWGHSGDYELKAERSGYEVKLRGAVGTDAVGVNGAGVMILPKRYRPLQDMLFPTSFFNGDTGAWVQCRVQVFATGDVTVTVDESVIPLLDTLNGYCLLSGINYFVR